MDKLKTSNAVVDWVAFSLELTVGAKLHNVFALSVTNVANVTLSSMK